MDRMDVIRRYVDAWNERDASAVLATLSPHGTYSDPATGGPLTGPALEAYVTRLWTAFPDLSFEIGEVADGGGPIAMPWTMRGTNSGAYMGLPPTGRSVVLRGADVVQLCGDRIRSVEGYFDTRTVPEQLGLQVHVQPTAIGPFTFGTGLRVSSGKTTRPGAYSITALDARSPAQVETVREQTRQIAAQMLPMKGFVGLVAAAIGQRMVTIVAWETPQDASQMRALSQHAAAVHTFHAAEVADGGFTSVWVPERIGVRWARCAACDRMVDTEVEACSCGHGMPAAMPYW